MKYPVFLQALALTVVVFLIGLYIGIVVEQKNVDEINEYVIQSEVSLLDVVALNNLIGFDSVSCEEVEKANFDFVDNVYQEAKLLEKYEKSGRLTESLKPIHKKYDVLRSYLWINLIKTKKLCDSNFSTIIYLYNYEEEDLTKLAEQNVWSKVLLEIKQDREDVFLIPIARDTNLVSLNSLLSKYEIESYPAVIVNEEFVFTDLANAQDIEPFLN